MTTYSPLLQLWQGVPGDPAIRNAWGTYLNENDNLIEQAITGDNSYGGGTGGINIAGLSTYSLTVANGQPDQARQLLYPFVGALTGSCTVTIALTVKFGWALNATTGAQNVLLTSGVGTQATLPPDGAMRFFYCDGNGNVTLPTVAFGGISDLTVASGGLTVISGGITVDAGGITVDAGGITVSGNSTIAGTLGGLTGLEVVSGGASIDGAITLIGGSLDLDNSQVVAGKDTGGTYRALIQIDSSNQVNTYVGGATGWRILSQSGTQLFKMDNVGNFTTGTSQSADPIADLSDGWYFAANGTTSGFTGSGTPLSLGTANAGGLVAFFNGAATQIGSITTDGATTSFNTTSDETLKIDDGLVSSAWAEEVLDNLSVHFYRMKAMPEAPSQPGFFARETHPVYPRAVTQGHGESGDEDFVPWQMDESKFSPLFVVLLQKALYEQHNMRREIHGLRARIADLEGK